MEANQKTDWCAECRLPSCSLVVVAVLLAVHELQGYRSGAELWLLEFGIRPWLALVLSTTVWMCCVDGKLSCHPLSPLMAGCESVAYAALLYGIAGMMTALFEMASLLFGCGITNIFVRTLVGVGLYEELIFRLWLLPLLYYGLLVCRVPHCWAIILSVFVSSVVFSLAHYIPPSCHITHLWQCFFEASLQVIRTPAHWGSFFFRVIAGILFAIVCITRGFGAAVMSHIVYNHLVFFTNK